MCGISGTAGYANAELLEAMNAAQAHRGPDDSGVWMSPDRELGLGADRLSILDLSVAGHMPMASESGEVVVTYNGEAYNFVALREELVALGHVFRSHSDTEVIVHGYEEWGAALFRRLNGMFALAVADLRPRRKGRPAELTLARDRFGVKPLYYVSEGGRLGFASEVKALLELPGAAVRPNLNVLASYLTFLYVPGPETMFEGVFKLPPGHYLRWCDGRSQLTRYWQQSFDPMPGRVDDLAAELREILARAVRRTLVSDVPVGLFLSGGLDSSTIAALAAATPGDHLEAYAISFKQADTTLEQSADDARYARLVARKFGLTLHERELDSDIVTLLPHIVYHLDEPVADPAAIATHLISSEARNRSKVLLSGQGADEIFAGYRAYWISYLGPRLQRLPPLATRALTGAAAGLNLAGSLPGAPRGLALAGKRYALKTLATVRLPVEEQFLAQHAYYSEAELRALLAPDVASHLDTASPARTHRRYLSERPNDDLLNRLLYVDSHTFLPDLNLTYCDKLSSANSIEVRVPFLDNEIVDFMGRVPPQLKLRGLTSKHLLKRAVRGLVPDAVIGRRKAGFGAPIRTWLRRDLKAMVGDLLSEPDVRRRGYFRPEAVATLLEETASGRRDHSYRIWALLTLELWHRGFVDRPVKAAAERQH